MYAVLTINPPTFATCEEVVGKTYANHLEMKSAPVVIRDHETLQRSGKFWTAQSLNFHPAAMLKKILLHLSIGSKKFTQPAAPLVEVHPVGNGRAAELARRVATFETSTERTENRGPHHANRGD